jgi:hypothetical protein
MKGIIYIMTTAVSGLIKIGQTGVGNYQERMRNLEANEQKGKLNGSGAYQGAAYWQYQGKRLRELADIN